MPVGYGGLNFNLVSLKKGEKLSNFGSAPKDNEFVLIEITVINNSETQKIIFPNEEIKLTVEDKKITPDNYTFKTNLFPGQDSRGYLLYQVPKGTRNAKLEFGKGAAEEVINLYFF